MRNFLDDLFKQMKGIWARLDAGQKLVVSAVLLATVAGLGGIVWFAGRPSYETVFTALPGSGSELAEAKQALASAGVAYVPDSTGMSLMVERGQLGLANQAILEKGLRGAVSPSVGGGLSLIEDAETKQWKLDAASRQSVVSAIQQLDGVMQATVTATKPRRQAAFRDRDDENKPSATIVLKLKNGVPFDSLARAASSLASSQLGVPQQNIEVVSSAGNQRFRYDPDREGGGGTSEFLKMQRDLSDERTNLAQARLDQLWPGKTNVAITVELDSAWEVRSEKVLPSEAIVRSEKVKKDETLTPAATADASAKTSKNETKDREFVTEIGERRVGKSMPDIKRVTVALIYDKSLVTPDFKPEDLVNTVKSIAGWDPSRDKPESFSTLVGEFAPVDMGPELSGGPGFGEVALRWGPTIGQILGVFVVVMFLRGLFKRGSSSVAAGAASAGGPAVKEEVDEKNLTPEELQKRMRREIERSIANDPASLAKLLENWLTEQKA